MSLELMVLAIIFTALTLYAVLGGADFGAGVWEFNTALRASERQRNLLYKAIGPVWETNHVWLIFVLVLLFGAFPPAYAALNEALFVPLLLALVGIVFRGAAFAFRSQLKAEPRKQRVWVMIFALASVLAPFFLGAAVGAIASGRLSFDTQGNYSGNRFSGWINSLAIFNGFFTVGLCAYCSATYMIREARLEKSPDLEQLWRLRALIVGAIMGLLALVGLALVATEYPLLWNGFQHRGWPLIVVSMIAGTFSLLAIYKSWLKRAVLGVSLTSATVVIGWGAAQFPYLIPPAWTMQSAASEKVVLRIILATTGLGMLLLMPALVLLLKIFKQQQAE